MAYVLSLRSHSPLKRSFSDNPYLQTCSPLKEPLLAPLSDITARNASACSLYSQNSNRAAGDWIRGGENTPPLTSRSQLSLPPSNRTRSIEHEPRKRLFGPDRPSSSSTRNIAPANPYSRRLRETHHVSEPSSSSSSSDEVIDDDAGDLEDLEESNIFDLYEAIHIPLPGIATNERHEESEEYEETPPVAVSAQPFRRWMSILRRRHADRRSDHIVEAPRLSLDSMLARQTRLPEALRRNSESMSSSMGCVLAMHAASFTIASTSIAPHSEKGILGRGIMGRRGSAFSENRRSTESHRGQLAPVIDESAWLRSLQRRKVVEELIASEEGYIADLKVLINVYINSFRPASH
jgi:hypothetical protein